MKRPLMAFHRSGCPLSLDAGQTSSFNARFAQVAQSVEQRTENPRVGGSIPPLGTNKNNDLQVFPVVI